MRMPGFSDHIQDVKHAYRKETDDSVDVVVHVDSQTKYTHHVELSEPLAPMPINVGAYTNTRLTIDEVFTSE